MCLLNPPIYGTGYGSGKVGNYKELEPKNLFRRSVTQTDEQKIDRTPENLNSTLEGLPEQNKPSDQHNLYILSEIKITPPLVVF